MIRHQPEQSTTSFTQKKKKKENGVKKGGLCPADEITMDSAQ